MGTKIDLNETVLEYLERKRVEFNEDLEGGKAAGGTPERFYLAGIVGGLEIACERVKVEEMR